MNFPALMPSSRLKENDFARRSLLFAAAIVVIAQAVVAYGIHSTVKHTDLPDTMAIGHALWGFVIFIVTWQTHTIRPRLASILTAILVAPVYAVIWFNHVALANSHVLWAPFSGLKAALLALAVIVPGYVWVNLLLMAGLAVEAIFLWYTLHLGSLPFVVSTYEPWFTILLFVVCAWLPLYRRSIQSLQRQLAVAEARAETLAQVAQLFLGIRDESNTPLQNLIAGYEILDRRHPEEKEVLAGINRATTRLRELSQRLRSYDEFLEWPQQKSAQDQSSPDKDIPPR